MTSAGEVQRRQRSPVVSYSRKRCSSAVSPLASGLLGVQGALEEEVGQGRADVLARGVQHQRVLQLVSRVIQAAAQHRLRGGGARPGRSPSSLRPAS